MIDVVMYIHVTTMLQKVINRFWLCAEDSQMTAKNTANSLQTPADDPCSCFYLRRAARLVTRQYAETMKPTGLKSGQFSILASLSLQGTQSITALAERMGLERTSLSRALRPLEKDGLINITAEQEKRRRFVELTKQGRATYKKALPLWNAAQSQYKKQLGAQEMKILKGLLERTAELVSG
ncbi:MAG: MarR family transcriptional regulator [SAR86 cluster bacterium]|uniref:MarR family transcriptional regulator n=1 Tax=SAR86 cluster bacterium TaxID=2030880 RepID=A0A2A4WYM6_9GAMM|nr:MAG: MarR family transcriptional regulator [SAR86 cluster bacterium]